MGVLGPPWKVSKEFNDVILVGYQFYSVFSTQNESRVDTYLRLQIRLPQGCPWGSMGPLRVGLHLNLATSFIPALLLLKGAIFSRTTTFGDPPPQGEPDLKS